MATAPGGSIIILQLIFISILDNLNISTAEATSSNCNSQGDVYGSQNWRLYRRCIHNRAGDLTSVPQSCTKRQYFDTSEGRCLGIPGGGRIVFVDNNAQCNRIGLIPHPTQARYYYVCKSYKVIVAKCIRAEIFNRQSNHCERRYIISSYNYKLSNPEHHPKLPPCEKVGKFPFPNDCSSYYQCSNNGSDFIQTDYKCPPNSSFNSTLGSCDVKTECKLSTHIILPATVSNNNYPKCTTAGRFSVPSNCTTYCMCSSNRGGDFIQECFSCPSGYVYDSKIKDCIRGSECITDSPTNTKILSTTSLSAFSNTEDTWSTPATATLSVSKISETYYDHTTPFTTRFPLPESASFPSQMAYNTTGRKGEITNEESFSTITKQTLPTEVTSYEYFKSHGNQIENTEETSVKDDASGTKRYELNLYSTKTSTSDHSTKIYNAEFQEQSHSTVTQNPGFQYIYTKQKLSDDRISINEHEMMSKYLTAAGLFLPTNINKKRTESTKQIIVVPTEASTYTPGSKLLTYDTNFEGRTEQWPSTVIDNLKSHQHYTETTLSSTESTYAIPSRITDYLTHERTTIKPQSQTVTMKPTTVDRYLTSKQSNGDYSEHATISASTENYTIVGSTEYLHRDQKQTHEVRSTNIEVSEVQFVTENISPSVKEYDYLFPNTTLKQSRIESAQGLKVDSITENEMTSTMIDNLKSHQYFTEATLSSTKSTYSDAYGKGEGKTISVTDVPHTPIQTSVLHHNSKNTLIPKLYSSSEILTLPPTTEVPDMDSKLNEENLYTSLSYLKSEDSLQTTEIKQNHKPPKKIHEQHVAPKIAETQKLYSYIDDTTVTPKSEYIHEVSETSKITTISAPTVYLQTNIPETTKLEKTADHSKVTELADKSIYITDKQTPNTYSMEYTPADQTLHYPKASVPNLYTALHSTTLIPTKENEYFTLNNMLESNKLETEIVSKPTAAHTQVEYSIVASEEYSTPNTVTKLEHIFNIGNKVTALTTTNKTTLMTSKESSESFINANDESKLTQTTEYIHPSKETSEKSTRSMNTSDLYFRKETTSITEQDLTHSKEMPLLYSKIKNMIMSTQVPKEESTITSTTLWKVYSEGDAIDKAALPYLETTKIPVTYSKFYNSTVHPSYHGQEERLTASNKVIQSEISDLSRESFNYTNTFMPVNYNENKKKMHPTTTLPQAEETRVKQLLSNSSFKVPLYYSDQESTKETTTLLTDSQPSTITEAFVYKEAYTVPTTNFPHSDWIDVSKEYSKPVSSTTPSKFETMEYINTDKLLHTRTTQNHLKHADTIVPTISSVQEEKSVPMVELADEPTRITQDYNNILSTTPVDITEQGGTMTSETKTYPDEEYKKLLTSVSSREKISQKPTTIETQSEMYTTELPAEQMLTLQDYSISRNSPSPQLKSSTLSLESHPEIQSSIISKSHYGTELQQTSEIGLTKLQTVPFEHTAYTGITISPLYNEKEENLTESNEFLFSQSTPTQHSYSKNINVHMSPKYPEKNVTTSFTELPQSQVTHMPHKSTRLVIELFTTARSKLRKTIPDIETRLTESPQIFKQNLTYVTTNMPDFYTGDKEEVASLHDSTKSGLSDVTKLLSINSNSTSHFKEALEENLNLTYTRMQTHYSKNMNDKTYLSASSSSTTASSSSSSSSTSPTSSSTSEPTFLIEDCTTVTSVAVPKKFSVNGSTTKLITKLPQSEETKNVPEYSKSVNIHDQINYLEEDRTTNDHTKITQSEQYNTKSQLSSRSLNAVDNYKSAYTYVSPVSFEEKKLVTTVPTSIMSDSTFISEKYTESASKIVPTLYTDSETTHVTKLKSTIPPKSMFSTSEVFLEKRENISTIEAEKQDSEIIYTTKKSTKNTFTQIPEGYADEEKTLTSTEPSKVSQDYTTSPSSIFYSLSTATITTPDSLLETESKQGSKNITNSIEEQFPSYEHKDISALSPGLSLSLSTSFFNEEKIVSKAELIESELKHLLTEHYNTSVTESASAFERAVTEVKKLLVTEEQHKFSRDKTIPTSYLHKESQTNVTEVTQSQSTKEILGSSVTPFTIESPYYKHDIITSLNSTIPNTNEQIETIKPSTVLPKIKIKADAISNKEDTATFTTLTLPLETKVYSEQKVTDLPTTLMSLTEGKNNRPEILSKTEELTTYLPDLLTLETQTTIRMPDIYSNKNILTTAALVSGKNTMVRNVLPLVKRTSSLPLETSSSAQLDHSETHKTKKPMTSPTTDKSKPEPQFYIEEEEETTSNKIYVSLPVANVTEKNDYSSRKRSTSQVFHSVPYTNYREQTFHSESTGSPTSQINVTTSTSYHRQEETKMNHSNFSDKTRDITAHTELHTAYTKISPSLGTTQTSLSETNLRIKSTTETTIPNIYSEKEKMTARKLNVTTPEISKTETDNFSKYEETFLPLIETSTAAETAHSQQDKVTKPIQIASEIKSPATNIYSEKQEIITSTVHVPPSEMSMNPSSSLETKEVTETYTPPVETSVIPHAVTSKPEKGVGRTSISPVSQSVTAVTYIKSEQEVNKEVSAYITLTNVNATKTNFFSWSEERTPQTKFISPLESRSSVKMSNTELYNGAESSATSKETETEMYSESGRTKSHTIVPSQFVTISTVQSSDTNSHNETKSKINLPYYKKNVSMPQTYTENQVTKSSTHNTWISESNAYSQSEGAVIHMLLPTFQESHSPQLHSETMKMHENVTILPNSHSYITVPKGYTEQEETSSMAPFTKFKPPLGKENVVQEFNIGSDKIRKPQTILQTSQTYSVQEDYSEQDEKKVHSESLSTTPYYTFLPQLGERNTVQKLDSVPDKVSEYQTISQTYSVVPTLLEKEHTILITKPGPLFEVNMTPTGTTPETNKETNVTTYFPPLDMSSKLRKGDSTIILHTPQSNIMSNAHFVAEHNSATSPRAVHSVVDETETTSSYLEDITTLSTFSPFPEANKIKLLHSEPQSVKNSTMMLTSDKSKTTSETDYEQEEKLFKYYKVSKRIMNHTSYFPQLENITAFKELEFQSEKNTVTLPFMLTLPKNSTLLPVNLEQDVLTSTYANYSKMSTTHTKTYSQPYETVSYTTYIPPIELNTKQYPDIEPYKRTEHSTNSPSSNMYPKGQEIHPYLQDKTLSTLHDSFFEIDMKKTKLLPLQEVTLPHKTYLPSFQTKVSLQEAQSERDEQRDFTTILPTSMAHMKPKSEDEEEEDEGKKHMLPTKMNAIETKVGEKAVNATLLPLLKNESTSHITEIELEKGTGNTKLLSTYQSNTRFSDPYFKQERHTTSTLNTSPNKVSVTETENFSDSEEIIEYTTVLSSLEARNATRKIHSELETESPSTISPILTESNGVSKAYFRPENTSATPSINTAFYGTYAKQQDTRVHTTKTSEIPAHPVQEKSVTPSTSFSESYEHTTPTVSTFNIISTTLQESFYDKEKSTRAKISVPLTQKSTAESKFYTDKQATTSTFSGRDEMEVTVRSSSVYNEIYMNVSTQSSEHTLIPAPETVLTETGSAYSSKDNSRLVNTTVQHGYSEQERTSSTHIFPHTETSQKYMSSTYALPIYSEKKENILETTDKSQQETVQTLKEFTDHISTNASAAYSVKRETVMSTPEIPQKETSYTTKEQYIYTTQTTYPAPNIGLDKLSDENFKIINSTATELYPIHGTNKTNFFATGITKVLHESVSQTLPSSHSEQETTATGTTQYQQSELPHKSKEFSKLKNVSVPSTFSDIKITEKVTTLLPQSHLTQTSRENFKVSSTQLPTTYSADKTKPDTVQNSQEHYSTKTSASLNDGEDITIPASISQSESNLNSGEYLYTIDTTAQHSHTENKGILTPENLILNSLVFNNYSKPANVSTSTVHLESVTANHSTILPYTYITSMSQKLSKSNSSVAPTVYFESHITPGSFNTETTQMSQGSKYKSGLPFIYSESDNSYVSNELPSSEKAHTHTSIDLTPSTHNFEQNFSVSLLPEVPYMKSKYDSPNYFSSIFYSELGRRKNITATIPVESTKESKSSQEYYKINQIHSEGAEVTLSTDFSSLKTTVLPQMYTEYTVPEIPQYSERMKLSTKFTHTEPTNLPPEYSIKKAEKPKDKSTISTTEFTLAENSNTKEYFKSTSSKVSTEFSKTDGTVLSHVSEQEYISPKQVSTIGFDTKTFNITGVYFKDEKTVPHSETSHENLITTSAIFFYPKTERVSPEVSNHISQLTSLNYSKFNGSLPTLYTEINKTNMEHESWKESHLSELLSKSSSADIPSISSEQLYTISYSNFPTVAPGYDTETSEPTYLGNDYTTVTPMKVTPEAKFISKSLPTFSNNEENKISLQTRPESVNYTEDIDINSQSTFKTHTAPKNTTQEHLSAHTSLPTTYFKEKRTTVNETEFLPVTSTPRSQNHFYYSSISVPKYISETVLTYDYDREGISMSSTHFENKTTNNVKYKTETSLESTPYIINMSSISDRTVTYPPTAAISLSEKSHSTTKKFDSYVSQNRSLNFTYTHSTQSPTLTHKLNQNVLSENKTSISHSTERKITDASTKTTMSYIYSTINSTALLLYSTVSKIMSSTPEFVLTTNKITPPSMTTIPDSLPMCDEIGSFRVPNSCHHYYECLYYGKGEIVQTKVKRCRGCFVFNSRLGVCDIPDNVPECSSNPKTLNCTGEGFFPVQGSTTMYYVCKQNAKGIIERERKECNKNLSYNQKTGQCTSAKDFNKSGDSVLQCTKSGFFAHPHDCNKFIHCLGKGNSSYISEIRSCSPKLYFNEVGGYCDHPENILSMEESYDNDVS